MTVILSPFEFSGTEQLGRQLFRKKVLPVGSIDYDGHRIDFTSDSLKTMVDAFNDGAYDNVPLQFADDNNKHTNDPERYRGDVVNMSLEDDGLYVTVATTSKGAEVLNENPKLGISARIVNEYHRSDGKQYKSAIQHVLATHDPRIPKLGAWSKVTEFSNDSDASDIIDLTNKTFKEAPVADALNGDELAKLRSFLAELDAEDATAEDEQPGELSDAELDELVASLAEDAGEPVVEPEAVPVAEVKVPASAGAELSNPQDDKAIELANAEIRKIRSELDDSRWELDRERLMRDTGLTPALLDLAAPLLKGSGHVIELSNGDEVDAGKVMNDFVTELGKTIKLLDLSTEQGSSVDGELDETAEAAAKRDETTKAVRAMMGN